MNAIPICFTTLPDYENSKVKNGAVQCPTSQP